MLSSYNTRSHTLTEEDFDDATMIDYIANSCDSSGHHHLHHHPRLDSYSNSTTLNTHPQNTNCILNNSFNQSGVSKIFTEFISSVNNNSNNNNNSSNTFLSGLIGQHQPLHHQNTTSPVSTPSLAESSQSNSPIANGTMYDADDSGLDTTNMSCATTDGYFVNNNHITHPQRHPQLMQETTGQIHANVNPSHPQSQLNQDQNQRQSHPPPPHPHQQHQQQQIQDHQQQLHHHQQQSTQFAPQFNCMRSFNRSISHQSDCSNLTSSDASTLTEFSALSSSGDTMSSVHATSGCIRSDRTPQYRPVGGQIHSLSEQTITDETSTLFEFPSTFHENSGVTSTSPSAGTGTPTTVANSTSPPSTSTLPVVVNASGSGSGIELKIMTEPARHHRARYRTEGSRGAIKDRTGRSFPVVKLVGYNCSPVKLRCYIGHDRNAGQPHLYYQVSRIIGKNITPCSVIKAGGVKMIEIDLLPENDMAAIINCIGIVKERNFDVQRRCIVGTPSSASTSLAKGGTGNCLKRKQPSTSHSSGDSSQVCRSSYSSPTVSKCTVTSNHVDTNNCDTKPCFGSNSSGQSSNSMANSPASRYQLEKRSTTCTLVFTCTIATSGNSSNLSTSNSNTLNLMAVSDVINCAQILGSPEIHKVSLTRDRITGGSEVFVIGKNFTRDSKIVWDICPSHLQNQSASAIDSKFWFRESDPESDFVNQNHLVFRVPPLKSLINEAPDHQGQGLLGQPSGDQIAYVAQNLLTSTQVQVQFRIRCGEKISEPHVFTFISDLPSDCDGLCRSSSF